MKFFPCFMVDCGAYREYTEEEALSIVPCRCRRCSSWKGFDFHIIGEETLLRKHLGERSVSSHQGEGGVR